MRLPRGRGRQAADTCESGTRLTLTLDVGKLHVFHQGSLFTPQWMNTELSSCPPPHPALSSFWLEFLPLRNFVFLDPEPSWVSFFLTVSSNRDATLISLVFLINQKTKAKPPAKPLSWCEVTPPRAHAACGLHSYWLELGLGVFQTHVSVGVWGCRVPMEAPSVSMVAARVGREGEDAEFPRAAQNSRKDPECS